jgi:hypothetical protein
MKWFQFKKFNQKIIMHKQLQKEISNSNPRNSLIHH